MQLLKGLGPPHIMEKLSTVCKSDEHCSQITIFWASFTKTLLLSIQQNQRINQIYTFNFEFIFYIIVILIDFDIKYDLIIII
jgi:hypothetical protein